MSEYHLITGATGFVGGAIALELLAQTQVGLVCLVRKQEGATPTERLHSSLSAAAHAYGRSELLPDIHSRTRAVQGDITGEMPSRTMVGPVDAVWHAAASLRFEARHAAEIEEQNVQGTRVVLGLARQAGATSFNHISTAYVAGTQVGDAFEIAPDDAVPVQNEYERSKRLAENLVVGAPDMRTRVLRPSIVIGHSETRVATSFTGMYGFLRELRAFQREVARRLGDFLTLRPVTILADPDTPVNLMTVDDVARQAVTVGRSDSSATYFHLTQPNPRRLEELLRLTFGLVGMREPRYATSTQQLNAIDRTLSDRLPFYGSYLTGNLRFGRYNTDAALGDAWRGGDLSPHALEPYITWYLRLLGAEQAEPWAATPA